MRNLTLGYWRYLQLPTYLYFDLPEIRPILSKKITQIISFYFYFILLRVVIVPYSNCWLFANKLRTIIKICMEVRKGKYLSTYIIIFCCFYLITHETLPLYRFNVPPLLTYHKT